MRKLLSLLTAILFATSLWATDVVVSIATYASAQGWASGTAYASISLDGNVTATGLTNGNNSKYYSTNSSWRHYEGDNGTITIATTSGTLSSVTFTYANANNGIIKDGSTTVSSGSAYSISGTSKTFSVGHSSGTKNGNVQITNISVSYTPAGGGTPATGIELNKTSTTLEQYREETLTATLTPNDATSSIEWTSSVPAVATVTNGLIKALTTGTTVITATAEENVQATCTVTVTAPTILTCAQAAEMAATVSGNNVKYAGGQYVVEGYAISKSDNNYLWIADAANAAAPGTFEIYQPTNKSEIASVVMGSKVRGVGYLTKYNTTYEFAAGCTFSIVPVATVTPTPTSFEVDHAAHAAQSVTLAYENWGTVGRDEVEVTVHSATPCTDGNKITSGAWISNITVAQNNNSFTFDIAANDGVARTEYLRIYALGDDVETDAEAVVTVTQAAAPVDPTITFKNSSVDEGYELDLDTLFTSNSTGAVTYSITEGGTYATLEGSILTGVAAGSVTVQASQAATLGYNAKSVTCTVTVTEHVVTPGKYTINLNKAFYGIATAGSVAEEQRASQNDITVVSGCASNAQNKTYYDAGHIRYYTDSYMYVSVPAGFKIDSIVFTAGGTWNGGISVNTGTYDNTKQTWTGNAQSVEFSFALQNRVASISVKYTAAVPEVTVNPASWDFESVVASEAASKVFSVSGSNLLAGDLTLTAPTGYSVSPAKITVEAAGALAATNVTVSKDTETPGTYNDDLTILGCGLTSSVKVSLKMIVTAAVVNVTSVSLDEHAITLEQDSTQTLIATVLPVDATNKAVTWASTNTAVATVEDGVVTAVAPGTAKISVTSDADETKTDTCVVTVTGADIILDFTDNTKWGFPASKGEEAEYSNGVYTIKMASGNFVSADNCLLIGKQDAYITLPLLADTAIAKIVTLGEETGSGSVKFNVYQGETAVSTEVTSCKVNQVFNIYPKKKNVAHSIVVTSDANARFNKIKIWYGPQDTATGVDNTDASVKAVKVLKDGQIFILRGEKVYTIQGQLVK